jgi:hypothetical protein
MISVCAVHENMDAKITVVDASMRIASPKEVLKQTWKKLASLKGDAMKVIKAAKKMVPPPVTVNGSTTHTVIVGNAVGDIMINQYFPKRYVYDDDVY